MHRIARVAFVLGGIVVAVSIAVSFAWVALSLAGRPLTNVEGEILFEADRLRAHLPLYVDPRVGAGEYGPPPARYLVLYPPLWSSVLSLVPTRITPLFARAATALSWLGAFALVVREARSRRVALVAASFFLGVWVLWLFAGEGRPDAIAVLLVAIALARSVHRDRLDAIAGAVFVLAAFVKPNVIGVMPGAFVGSLLVSGWRKTLPGVVGAAIAGALILGAFYLEVGHAFFDHLLASTGQPPSRALWGRQIAARGPFFLPPVALALVCGLRCRRLPGVMIATAGLVTSIAWCLVSLAKIGSASNYFLEPAIATTMALGQAGIDRRLGDISRLGFAALSVYAGVATIRSAPKGIAMDRRRAVALRQVAAECPGVTIADEPGIERELDGRIVATPFQSTYLVRRGAFPIDAWIADVRRPEVSCLLVQNDALDAPPDAVDVENDRFPPALRRALRERFAAVGLRADYRLYRARDKEK